MGGGLAFQCVSSDHPTSASLFWRELNSVWTSSSGCPETRSAVPAGRWPSDEPGLGPRGTEVRVQLVCYFVPPIWVQIYRGHDSTAVFKNVTCRCGVFGGKLPSFVGQENIIRHDSSLDPCELQTTSV